MRDRYKEQLRLLSDELKSMGEMCREAIGCAVSYLTQNDPEMKANAKECEKQTDRMERDIEALCMRLLMRQQPLAADFRFVTAALKMTSDMERIGDHADDIAEIGDYVGKTDIKLRSKIAEISDSASEMLKTSIESYTRQNAELAQSAIAMDDDIDRLFLEFKQKLIETIHQKNEDAEALLDLLMIAKYFERIGDHAENIAQWVIYAVKGERRA